MKSTSQLHAFYRTKLLKDLKALDATRQGLVKKIFLIGIICIAPAGYLVLKVIQDAWPALLLAIPALLGFALYWLIVKPSYATYVANFKKSIIKELVAFLDPSLTYLSTGCINKQTFRNCGIFHERIDRYEGDDFVEGTVGSTQIEFSEIHAEEKRERMDSDGRRNTEWRTIFKGLFFCADFNKHFKGETYVLTDIAESALGFIGTKLQKMNKSHGQLIKLEDPVFEKEFVVYGDDQIEARYILSPALMERIVKLRQKSKRRVQLSFINSCVYIAIPYAKDLFEPRLFAKNADFEGFEEYFEDLSLALGIVEDLNLNNRIWTKR